MLFRTANGELVQINRYDLINDKMYYEKIMEIKKQFLNKNKSSKLDNWTKSKETFNNKNN
jgi:hypothetical protein